jgi:hypothetical protein
MTGEQNSLPSTPGHVSNTTIPIASSFLITSHPHFSSFLYGSLMRNFATVVHLSDGNTISESLLPFLTGPSTYELTDTPLPINPLFPLDYFSDYLPSNCISSSIPSLFHLFVISPYSSLPFLPFSSLTSPSSCSSVLSARSSVIDASLSPEGLQNSLYTIALRNVSSGICNIYIYFFTVKLLTSSSNLYFF